MFKITRKSEPASYGFGISLNDDGQGATTGEYLDRLRLHNDIFNADVRLEGVIPTAGNTKIVTSQPFIKGEAASPERIDAHMAGKGVERLAEGAYYHPLEQVLVHDLHPRNALVTTTGKLRVIDPAIMRADPRLANDVRRAGNDPKFAVRNTIRSTDGLPEPPRALDGLIDRKKSVLKAWFSPSRKPPTARARA